VPHVRPRGVQFQDILYKMSPDILYTSPRARGGKDGGIAALENAKRFHFPSPRLLAGLSTKNVKDVWRHMSRNFTPKGRSPTTDFKTFGAATTLYETVALSFVIPSEAEGSAVPRTFRGNANPSAAG
jgi:hypothetical protein